MTELLDIYRMVYGPPENIEWSGYVRGPGSGPMFSGNDGEKYPACPVCGGLKEPNGAFIASAVGHRPRCKLKGAIRKYNLKHEVKL